MGQCGCARCLAWVNVAVLGMGQCGCARCLAWVNVAVLGMGQCGCARCLAWVNVAVLGAWHGSMWLCFRLATLHIMVTHLAPPLLVSWFCIP